MVGSDESGPQRWFDRGKLILCEQRQTHQLHEDEGAIGSDAPRNVAGKKVRGSPGNGRSQAKQDTPRAAERESEIVF